MSEELVQMMQKMDLENVETQIALQCAPVITGLKVSNLLIVSNKNVPHVEQILGNTEIFFEEMLQGESQTTFLVYNQQELKKYLKREKVRSLLQQLGYVSGDIDVLLSHIGKKYHDYMKYGGMFPHEMGLLLGYPTEDVKGFIENNGKNFLYAGYWKVYDNLQAKQQLFCKFEQACETVLQLISRGVSIIDIINKYVDVKKELLQKAVG